MLINPGLAKAIENTNEQLLIDTFFGLLQRLPSNYKLYYFHEDKADLTPKRIHAIDSMIAKEISDGKTYSKNPHSQVLMLEINGEAVGVALFFNHNLIALASSVKGCGYGKLLYGLGLLLNQRTIFYQSLLSANAFYQALGSVRINNYNHWDHRISVNHLNEMLKNIRFKNINYPALNASKIRYFNRLGLLNEKKSYPDIHHSSNKRNLNNDNFQYLTLENGASCQN